MAPRGLATRPTTDRVREALFAIIGDPVGLRVLDLYSGSGALGLEALSRGAEHATFVERARQAQLALRQNVEALGVGARVSLLGCTVERALGPLARERFGLVLCDPPYAELARATRSLGQLRAAGIFADDVVVVLEHGTRDTPDDFGLGEPARRTYGDTTLSIYERRSDR